MIGKRFDRLEVMADTGRRDKHGNAWYLCRCKCGRTREVRGIHLKRPNGSRSCGCLRLEIHTTHGHAARGMHTAAYRAYRGMLSRCMNPSSRDWERYGGRGITVCSRWLESFASFLADMGNTPGRGYSLDRIKNNQGYEPGNCRWATRRQQNLNKRSNHRIAFRGESLTLAEWSERLGISANRISQRLRAGWPVERALTEHVGTYHGKTP